MEWKIFYSNSTYSSDDGPPELAPKRDVQTVAVADDTCGRRIERGDNFYVYRHGWRGCDQFGLYDYLIEPGYKIVLFGRSLTDDEYTLTRGDPNGYARCTSMDAGRLCVLF